MNPSFEARATMQQPEIQSSPDVAVNRVYEGRETITLVPRSQREPETDASAGRLDPTLEARLRAIGAHGLHIGKPEERRS